VEARALTGLVEAALTRAWRRDSSLHGDEHWRCVTATGLALAPSVGDVDRTLVFCFGLLHDTRRLTDSLDPEHGARAASFASDLRGEGVLLLDESSFARLAEALVDHSNGLVSTDPTIGTCWDADRLHLPRVGIHPRHELVSTGAAWGEAPAAAAAQLRTDGAPSWETLIASAARRP
jgi:uncharacterized protein